MKFSSLFVCCVLLLSATVADGAFIPFQRDAGMDQQVDYDLTEFQSGLSVQLKTPGLITSSQTHENRVYQQISINGGGRNGAVGDPGMPFKGMFVEVPHGVNVEVDTKIDWQVLPGEFRILPVQQPEPETIGADTEPEFVINEQTYQLNKWLPEKPVTIAQDGVIRGRRVLFLEISPVRYNPAVGTLQGAARISIELKYKGDIDVQAETQKARLASPGFEKQAASLIANYKPVKGMSHSDGKDGADYLIVTADMFQSELTSLVNWKTIKGYRTEVRTLTDVGGSTSTDIQNFLQSVYDTWSPVPEYVLLVGDVGNLPSRIETPDAYGNDFPTDLGYSLLQGSDYFPDIFLARISVETTTECAIVMNKFLNYDRTPEIDDWYNSALIAAYLQDTYSPYCEADRWFFETGVHVLEYLRDDVGMDIYTAMCTGASSSCNPIDYRSDSYPNRPSHPTSVPAMYQAMMTTASQATSDISSAINTGVGIVQHRDHGDWYGWGDPPFEVSDVNSLSNGTRTPMVFSINCLTGQIDYSSQCFAEAFLRKNNGGCVGIAAATRVSYSGWNDLLTHGIYTSFWPGYDTAHSGNIYNNSYNPCEALNFGKYYMYMYEGNSADTLYEFRLFHWFGDPEMLIRTDTPVAPTATLPASFSAGSTQVTFPCADNGALVGISQSGTRLGSGYVSGGQADITLDTAISAGSDVLVVITGYNLDPLEQTVPCGATSCGVVDLDQAIYSCFDSVTVTLLDSDLNTNPSTVQTHTVWLYSTTDVTGEMITVTETAADTGIFTGTAQTVSGAPGFGQIRVAHGDTLTAEYDDADCGGSPQTVNDTATIDCVGPVISNVTITNITGSSATVTWNTDVPSPSRLRYGTGTPATYQEDTALNTSHSLVLTSLTMCSTYYVEIEAEDTVGNITVDTNSGSYYSFVTLGEATFIDENMDTDPGWTTEGLWAWGVPTGGGGEHGNPDPTAGYNGANVYGYNLNGDYEANLDETYLTTGVFDCSDANTVTLSFWRWLNVEQPAYDSAAIEFSTNGSTWTEIWSNSETIEEDSWSYHEFDLTSELAGVSTCYLRWVMGETDSTWFYSGWNLDDILVEGEVTCTSPTNTPIPTNTPTNTPIPTNTPTNTPIPTNTPTNTPIPTNTPTPTNTQTATPTNTQTPTPTNTPTTTPTNTPVPTDTPIPATSTPDMRQLPATGPSGLLILIAALSIFMLFKGRRF